MRLFTAIRLPAEVRHHLCAAQQELDASRAMTGVKWTPAENLHVTLKFLGEIRQEDSARVIDELGKVQVLPATLFVDHITGFPKRGRAHVVVGALAGECEKVGAMFDQIENACELIGVPRDRRGFTPHVTIGRSRDGVNLSKYRGEGSFPGPSFAVESFDLMMSTLTPRGPIYEALATYKGR